VFTSTKLTSKNTSIPVIGRARCGISLLDGQGSTVSVSSSRGARQRQTVAGILGWGAGRWERARFAERWPSEAAGRRGSTSRACSQSRRGPTELGARAGAIVLPLPQVEALAISNLVRSSRSNGEEGLQFCKTPPNFRRYYL
jgi:hypothetical protein